MKNNILNPFQRVQKYFNCLYKFIIFFTLFNVYFFSFSAFGQSPQWVHIDTINSNLPYRSVNEITQDNEGFIWVTTDNGFAKYLGNYQWQVFHNPMATVPPDLCGSIVAQDSIIWVGTIRGLVRYCNGQITVFDPSNSNLPSYIYSLAVENNDLWIGTGDYGVYKYNGNTFRNYSYFNTGNMPLGNIWSIAIDQFGQKWFSCIDARSGFSGPTIVKFDNVNWTLFDTSNSGLQTYPIEISIDAMDHKWITSNGNPIVVYDNLNWITYDSILVGSPVTFHSGRVAIDDNDNKWITINGGLCKYDNSSWTFFDTSNVPFPTQIKSSRNIFVDNMNNKWIGTGSKGILIYNENGVRLTDISEVNNSSSSIVYPNPSTDVINLEFTLHHSTSIQYSISDLKGKNIYSSIGEVKAPGKYKTTVPLKLPSGVYLLSLRTDENLISRKIVIYN